MEVRAKLRESVPFTVMVIMEGVTIGLTIIAKTAMTDGMSPFVFVVYTNAIGSIILLPTSFFFLTERTEERTFTLRFLVRLFLLGLIGVTIPQNLVFVGLSYSSPIIVCAMGLLLPTFSFILAIILRRTKLAWRNSILQAKVIGGMISIMGAIIVGIYKGPALAKSSSSSSLQTQFMHRLLVFTSTTEHWVLGGVLLAAATMSISVWNIIQMETVKLYPQLQVMKIVSLYSLVGTIQCIIVSAIIERDLSAWKLKLDMELLLVISTAVFGSGIRTRVHIWCMQTRGPFYVTMFKPFGIVFATIFGASFCATTIHYGSILATIIVGIGYYTVMWGQLREDEKHEDQGSEAIESSAKVPLLLEEEQV